MKASEALTVNADSGFEEVYVYLLAPALVAVVPTIDQTVSEWADENRMLPSKAAAEPGPWRTDRTPYLREIMDALSADSPYQMVVVVKGAQIGFTELGLNWLGYIIDLGLGSIMIVWPTLNDIKSNVRVRIDPMFAATPCVGDKIGDPSGPKDGANNTFLKDFPNGYLAFGAANSATSLRSKPVRFLFLDEVDGYPGDISGEGEPLGLAMARTQSYGKRKKILLGGTPTIEGSSRVDSYFETTDMRQYYVPCPFCGVYQTLVFEQMRHEKGRPDKAWYECIFCAGEIQNYHKVEMLPRGEWRPEKESVEEGRIGFRISALYSPVGMLSWGEIMLQYTEALKDIRKMKVFVNTVLGLSYAEKGERPEWEKLFMRREEYEIGSVPEKVLLITAGIDVQKDRIEVEVVGWGRGKETWSLGYHVFMGKTDDLGSESWNGLRMLLDSRFAHPAAGMSLPIGCAAIDAGYETMLVYNFAREYESPKLIVTKGSDALSQPVGIPRAVDVKLPNGKVAKRGVKYHPVGVSDLKHELYRWLRLEKAETGSFPPGYCHFPQYGDEYFKQLTAEAFIRHESRSTKVTRGEWKKVQGRERNEALDCRIYARAAAAVLRIDLYQEKHWEQLERDLGIGVEDAPVAVNSGPQARPQRSRYRSKGITL